MSKVRKSFVVLLFSVLFVVPAYAALAQDTEIPPTAESFPTVEQAPVTIEPTVTPTEVPTAEPSPTPVPPPLPVPPTPLETAFAQINWTVLLLGVFLSFFAVIAYGFQKLAVSVPLAVWEGGKAAVRANYGAVDTIVNNTPDPTDNVEWKSLHDKIENQFDIIDQQRQDMEQLRSEVAANKRVAANNLAEVHQAVTQQIAASAQSAATPPE